MVKASFLLWQDLTPETMFPRPDKEAQILPKGELQ